MADIFQDSMLPGLIITHFHSTTSCLLAGVIWNCKNLRKIINFFKYFLKKWRKKEVFWENYAKITADAPPMDVL